MKKNLKNSPIKLKTFGYIRVSTEDQVNEGFSLDVQTEKIENYARFKDLELVEIIRDEGYSGKNMFRPGLQKLIELIDDTEPKSIVVYKLDRLTRNTGDLLYLVENVFKRTKTRFFSITEEIDTDSAMGKFFLTIMGAMAQMERELIAERTKAALQYKQQQGQHLGQVPFGFSVADGMLVDNPEELRVLRNMKRWKKEGLSYRQIASLLNEKNVETRRQGTVWHASTVHFILKRVTRNLK